MNNAIPPQFQALFTDAQTAFEKLMAAAPLQDAKHNVDALMQQSFSKMGLVTRAEFDVQRDMLLALRERLAQLEAALNAKS